MRRNRSWTSTFAHLLVLGLLGIPVARAAEPDLRPELSPRGRVDELTVSPSGDLWFGTAMGHAYVSRDGNRSWQEVEVTERRVTPEEFFGDHLSLVRFFDERRGFVAGYIGEDHDLILRTTDGGETWVKTGLPQSGLWVYDAQVTAEGVAWLVGSSGDVIFSEDFGESWRLLPRPFESGRSHAVHFVDAETGLVAGGSAGLAFTSDGGESWLRIPTPAAQGKGKSCQSDERVEVVTVIGDRLLITQCMASFVGALDSVRPDWHEVTAGGRAIVDFALHGDRIVAVTEDLEVVFLDRELEEVAPAGLHLQSYPRSLDVSGERIAILQTDGRVSLGDGSSFETSRMFGKGTATSWPIVDADRDREGVLWGISAFFLYRSSDGGRTWARLAELEKASRGLAVQTSGAALLWDGHGSVVRWSPEKGLLSPVPVLDGLDVVGLFRRGDLWLAYGGMQDETTARIEVARTYFGGQFAGSVPYGFVAGSTDGGESWALLDRWEDGGVQRIFLADDDRLFAVSWLGAVRRGRLLTDDAGKLSLEMATVLPATEETRDAVPYVERVSYLEFLRGETGWVFGWTHHLGTFLFRTADGGKSWKEAKCGPCFGGPYRLGGGRWVALDHPRTLRIWTGKAFRRLEELASEIQWVRVDSTGSLLVELEDGSLRALSRDGTEWEVLRGASADRR